MLPKELSKKKLLILSSIVVVLLLALIASLFKQKQTLEEKMMVDEQAMMEQPVTDLGRPDLPVVQAPVMTFSDYQTGASSVSLPANVKVYTFRSNYSLPYVSVVGQKLGLSESKKEGNTLLLYNTTDENNRGYLKFSLDSGKYEFSSYGDHLLPQSGGSLTDNVRSYLVDLGLADDTVTCNITYQRVSIPGTTFVECHRDWGLAGLPILNFVGLLNFPDLTSLSSVQVGMVDENSPEDPDITNVSTGQNGKERPDDFNTVTMAVNESGNVYHITSNLRMIEASIDFSQPDLLTPEEALNRFRNGTSSLSLVEPVDENAAWETVFPGNTAYNLNASVNDVMLTYVENPFAGKSLTPMYLSRGTAQTVEGYQVRFLQALPALKNQQSLSGEVAGLMAQNQPIPTQFYDETLKLGTFNPEQRSLPQTPPEGSPCVPAENQLSPIIDLGEFGRVGQFTLNIPTLAPGQKTVRARQWFLIPASTSYLPEINSVISAFDSLSLEEKHADEIRDLDELQKQWDKYNFCPLRLTGSSPTLIGYGKSGSSYRIEVGRNIVYLKTNSDNTIYYEYQPVSFTRPENGWNVNKASLNSLVRDVGKELGLTAGETDKLVFELNLAASKVTADVLFVGPIGQNEVDQMVPLKVTPQVPVQRYHFYVARAGQEVAAPNLTPVSRTAEMVLELGAVAQ